MTSSEVTYRFLAITRDWNKIETPKHVHRVCLVETDRLITAWPFWVRSWPWPEVKFKIWPFEVKLYIIRRVLIKQTRWCANYVCHVSITSYCTKHYSWKLATAWHCMTSGSQTAGLISNLLTSCTFRIKRVVECFFPRLSSSSSFRATGRFCPNLTPMMSKSAKFDLFLASGDLIFDLRQKWPLYFLEILSRAIQRRLPLVATLRSFLDLRGGGG